MNPKDQIPQPEESLDELVDDAIDSVDDFIRELEAKEKDLHITADLQIEIEQSEYDPRLTTDFAPEIVPEPEPADPVEPPKAAVKQRPPSGAEPGLKTRVYDLEKEVESLHERVRELKSERNEIQEKSDRR